MTTKQNGKSPGRDIIFGGIYEAKNDLNRIGVLAGRIKIGLVAAFLGMLVMTLTGCVGVVGGGDGYYGGGYYDGWWGGWWGGDRGYGRGYERGHDVHGYSARGSASRGAAHGGGGGGHGGGGGRH